MIKNFFRRIFQRNETSSIRQHRVYTIHRGNPVAVTPLEKQWLEDDYEALYGVTPIFRTHPHPAVAEGKELISLKSELRLHW